MIMIFSGQNIIDEISWEAFLALLVLCAEKDGSQAASPYSVS